MHISQVAGPAVLSSVYSLKCYFLEVFLKAEANQHYYCSCCQRHIESAVQTCIGSECNQRQPATFITIPLVPQIKQMMEGVHTMVSCVLRFVCWKAAHDVCIHTAAHDVYTSFIIPEIWGALQQRFSREDMHGCTLTDI